MWAGWIVEIDDCLLFCDAIEHSVFWIGPGGQPLNGLEQQKAFRFSDY